MGSLRDLHKSEKVFKQSRAQSSHRYRCCSKHPLLVLIGGDLVRYQLGMMIDDKHLEYFLQTFPNAIQEIPAPEK